MSTVPYNDTRTFKYNSKNQVSILQSASFKIIYCLLDHMLTTNQNFKTKLFLFLLTLTFSYNQSYYPFIKLT